MIKFLNRIYMNEAGADGADGGGTQTPEGHTPPQSPNADWQNDPKLDENGNPKEDGLRDRQDGGELNNELDKVDESGKDQPEKQEQKEERKYDLDSPVVQQVEKLIVEAGLNAADVAKIVSQNDGVPTPELVKAIADKHGDAVASIVAEQLKGFHKANVERVGKRDQAIYDQVSEAFKGVTEQSGQDSWKELSGWAKENIPNEERKEINKMLQQGGLAAKYAVDDLVNRFKGSDSFVQSADLVSGDNTPNDFGIKPMSKSDYQREFRALEAKGHVYGQSAELAALDRRREAGMARGI